MVLYLNLTYFGNFKVVISHTHLEVIHFSFTDLDVLTKILT